MVVIFPTAEDRLKLKVSLEVDFDLDVSEYTRECMREYARACHMKEKHSWRGKSVSLEEGLISLACQREEVGKVLRRKIDERALGLIKRCCKKNTGFVKEYYRAYRNFRSGVFYINDKEEDCEEV